MWKIKCHPNTDDESATVQSTRSVVEVAWMPVRGAHFYKVYQNNGFSDSLVRDVYSVDSIIGDSVPVVYHTSGLSRFTKYHFHVVAVVGRSKGIMVMPRITIDSKNQQGS